MSTEPSFQIVDMTAFSLADTRGLHYGKDIEEILPSVRAAGTHMLRPRLPHPDGMGLRAELLRIRDYNKSDLRGLQQLRQGLHGRQLLHTGVLVHAGLYHRDRDLDQHTGIRPCVDPDEERAWNQHVQDDLLHAQPHRRNRPRLDLAGGAQRSARGFRADS